MGRRRSLRRRWRWEAREHAHNDRNATPTLGHRKPGTVHERANYGSASCKRVDRRSLFLCPGCVEADFYSPEGSMAHPVLHPEVTV